MSNPADRLAAVLAEVTPPFSLRVTSGVLLDRFRSDPEVARLFDEWYEVDMPGAVA